MRGNLKTYKIAVIEGDGIGREVVPEGIRVLDAAASRFDFSLSWQHFDWSCQTYLKTGHMMPEDGLEQLRPFDAVTSVRSVIPAFPITFHYGDYSSRSVAASRNTSICGRLGFSRESPVHLRAARLERLIS